MRIGGRIAITSMAVWLPGRREPAPEHPAVIDAVVCCRTTADARPTIEAHVAATGPVSEDALTGWCQVRLSDFKIPRRWHIGSTVPRTSAGKIDRAVLMEGNR